MKIAVASGKGGTGKTMVATSLAASIEHLAPTRIIDCDVEAPNAHLFLKPVFSENKPAVIRVPEINPSICTLCGDCVRDCEFHALAQLGEKILVFPQLCHGCGTCSIVCPVRAIGEVPREIGQMDHGSAREKLDFFMGKLIISEPMATPIIRQLKKWAAPELQVVILDSPPGASCSVVATLSDADFVLLVTEPTPFGLHDLKQMLGVLDQIKAPAAVIINRDGIGDEQVELFLSQTPYPILMRIPYDDEIAIGLAEGRVLADFKPDYQKDFIRIYEFILEATEKDRVSQ